VVEPVLDSDWARIAELMEEYLDLPVGTVDASVIALAERRGLKVIATLDQRHFRVVGPRHVEAFTLVP
jgi:predicted nucleic acid-binding protein